LKNTLIICHHDIPSLEEYKMTIKILRKIYKFLSLDEFIKSKKTGLRPSIALTFDDNYKEWYDISKFLSSLEIPHSFFLTTNFYDKKFKNKNIYIKNLDRKKVGLEPLTKNQIKEISNSPFCNFECHGHNHLDFSKLSYEEIEYEILTCSNLIKDLTGRNPKYFAYPFGRFNNLPKKSPSYSKYGIEAAFTARRIYPDFYNIEKNFVFPRTIIDAKNFFKVASKILLNNY
jgi:peptidoglycan/xylan/chitin deacetylase (PgdA/CDA1 family)